MRIFKKVVKISFFILISILFVVTLLFCLFNFGLLDNFAEVKFDKTKLNYVASKIEVFDKDGNELIQNKDNQKNLSLNQIPKDTINAFISIEDKNFYEHNGINYKRIVKATLKNITSRKYSQGASTISQQLIKNTHLSSEKTLKRKFNELILTKELENTLTKDEILTAYLNAIYFGNGAFGINQASQRYFSKNANELNLNESAMLAGLIKSPKTYSPITNPSNCIKRRNLVLKQMLKDKKISNEEYQNSINQGLNLNINQNFLNNNTYYNACIDEACDILKISEKDLVLKNFKIKTYLNTDLQNIVEKQINNISSYTKQQDIDGLVMTIDNKTGGITAFCGKSDYNLLNIKRQPGSVFKPIIAYAPAIEYNVLTPITPILDEKININGYSPNNYKNTYHGWISVKNALANSYNIPSIKTLDYVGIDRAKTFARQLNIQFDELDAGYSIALGGLTNGLKIKDITNCYQAFANSGKYIKASFIKSIENENGKILYSNNETKKQVMKESTSYLITDMLRECVNNGTCRKLKLNGLNIAGKTGTVASANSDYNENSDAWNISYTPNQTMCVWLGSTNNDKLLSSKITGSNAPCEIAQRIYLQAKRDNSNFSIPNSVKEVEINEIEYTKNNKILLASPNTPDRYKMKALFSIDILPKETSSMFNNIETFKIYAKKLNNDSVELTLNVDKYLKYEVFCENDNKIYKLATIQDKQGPISFVHKDLKIREFYKYYCVAYFSNKPQIDTKSKKSNEILIYIL